VGFFGGVGVADGLADGVGLAADAEASGCGDIQDGNAGRRPLAFALGVLHAASASTAVAAAARSAARRRDMLTNSGGPKVRIRQK
jgi:hypothetical protein